MITWLWNSMEPSIAATTIWVDTTKELWDSLQDRFGQSKNVTPQIDVGKNMESLNVQIKTRMIIGRPHLL